MVIEKMRMMMVREGGTGGRANPLISVRGKPNTSLSHSAGRTVRRRTDWPTNDLPARPAGWLAANKPLITLLGEHRADVEKLEREQGLPFEVRGGLLDLEFVGGEFLNRHLIFHPGFLRVKRGTKWEGS